PTVVRQRPDRELMADDAARIVEMAAAAPNESALEGPLDPDVTTPDAEHGGLFTRHLVQALETAPASATYRDVLIGIAARLEEDEAGQTPQISGEAGRALFSSSVPR